MPTEGTDDHSQAASPRISVNSATVCAETLASAILQGTRGATGDSQGTNNRRSPPSTPFTGVGRTTGSGDMESG